MCFILIIYDRASSYLTTCADFHIYKYYSAHHMIYMKKVKQQLSSILTNHDSMTVYVLGVSILTNHDNMTTCVRRIHSHQP